MELNTENMRVRSFLRLVRANSANSAAPAPAPKPINNSGEFITETKSLAEHNYPIGAALFTNKLTYNEAAAHYHVLGSCSEIHKISCGYDNNYLYGISTTNIMDFDKHAILVSDLPNHRRD